MTILGETFHHFFVCGIITNISGALIWGTTSKYSGLGELFIQLEFFLCS